MAVTTTVTKVAVVMKLEDSTTATGAVKTVSVLLGSLNKDAYDAQKVMNIVGMLSQLFTKSLYKTQKTEVSDLEEE